MSSLLILIYQTTIEMAGYPESKRKPLIFFKEKILKNASTYYNFLWRFVHLKSFHTWQRQCVRGSAKSSDHWPFYTVQIAARKCLPNTYNTYCGRGRVTCVRSLCHEWPLVPNRCPGKSAKSVSQALSCPCPSASPEQTIDCLSVDRNTTNYLSDTTLRNDTERLILILTLMYGRSSQASVLPPRSTKVWATNVRMLGWLNIWCISVSVCASRWPSRSWHRILFRAYGQPSFAPSTRSTKLKPLQKTQTNKAEWDSSEWNGTLATNSNKRRVESKKKTTKNHLSYFLTFAHISVSIKLQKMQGTVTLIHR